LPLAHLPSTGVLNAPTLCNSHFAFVTALFLDTRLLIEGTTTILLASGPINLPSRPAFPLHFICILYNYFLSEAKTTCTSGTRGVPKAISQAFSLLALFFLVPGTIFPPASKPYTCRKGIFLRRRVVFAPRRDI
jgi:hypothetical protein